jgi:hypothetical protein
MLQYNCIKEGDRMPYDVERRGSSYVVVDDDGKVVGRHDSKQEAVNHQRALYANVPDASKSGQIDNNWSGLFAPRRG